MSAETLDPTRKQQRRGKADEAGGQHHGFIGLVALDPAPPLLFQQPEIVKCDAPRLELRSIGDAISNDPGQSGIIRQPWLKKWGRIETYLTVSIFRAFHPSDQSENMICFRGSALCQLANDVGSSQTHLNPHERMDLADCPHHFYQR